MTCEQFIVAKWRNISNTNKIPTDLTYEHWDPWGTQPALKSETSKSWATTLLLKGLADDTATTAAAAMVKTFILGRIQFERTILILRGLLFCVTVLPAEMMFPTCDLPNLYRSHGQSENRE